MQNVISKLDSLSKKRLLKIVDQISKDTSIIEKLYKSPRYSDEPLIHQFVAKIRDTSTLSDASDDAGYGSGSSFNKDLAKIKAVFEAVERYCLSIYKNKQFQHKSIQISGNSFSIHELDSIDESELNSQKVHSHNKKKLQWVDGCFFSEAGRVKTLIPAQLVFVPYKFVDEKVLRFPISTGAACGSDLDDAIMRGILEVAERDAFMAHFLIKSFGERIDVADDPKLKQVVEYFKQYDLELYLFSLQTDLPFCTILSVIIDRSGVGPAVSAGMKCGFEPDKVITGAIEESWHSRPWMRDELIKKPDIDSILKSRNQIIEIKDRGLLWTSVKMIKEMRPWINNSKKVTYNQLKNIYKKNKMSLQTLVKYLNSQGYRCYYVDVTRDEIKKYGYSVVKVIIPGLQPLYLEEPYPNISKKRLLRVAQFLKIKNFTLSDINRKPHFFL